MSQYKKLAQIYDYLMSGVDYDEWAEYIKSIAEKFNCKVEKVLDLACGTGNSSLSLAKKGFKVVGVDLSPEMLKAAEEKSVKGSLDIAFIEQDMRRLHLPEEVDMTVVYQDGLNYMLEDEDLKGVFKRVHRHLKEKGLFVFDINSVDKLPTVNGEVTYHEEDSMNLIWESGYDYENQVWEICLTGFLKKDNGYYDKFKEIHREKYYPAGTITFFLEETGFEVMAVYKAFTFEEGKDSDKRLYYVARKV
ncbi:MAG: class I SAM-dependent methyltransferase [Firmicutes bacterium HGW-Firmicutes-13]|nr:MAG: class I SAM-dependent methyltransferase [Firmicutes bacterium HGW-Firmicutes-13]